MKQARGNRSEGLVHPQMVGFQSFGYVWVSQQASRHVPPLAEERGGGEDLKTRSMI